MRKRKDFKVCSTCGVKFMCKDGKECESWKDKCMCDKCLECNYLIISHCRNIWREDDERVKVIYT